MSHFYYLNEKGDKNHLKNPCRNSIIYRFFQINSAKLKTKSKSSDIICKTER